MLVSHGWPQALRIDEAEDGLGFALYEVIGHGGLLQCLRWVGRA